LHAYITRNKLDRSCNALKHILVFFSFHCLEVIACICITRNKLDMPCNAMKHILGVFFFIAQRFVNPCICITRNKLDMSCNALKHILGVFFSLHRSSYCVHMHNEKQVRSVMQCTETHLRCFLFTAQSEFLRVYA